MMIYSMQKTVSRVDGNYSSVTCIRRSARESFALPRQDDYVSEELGKVEE